MQGADLHPLERYWGEMGGYGKPPLAQTLARRLEGRPGNPVELVAMALEYSSQVNVTLTTELSAIDDGLWGRVRYSISVPDIKKGGHREVSMARGGDDYLAQLIRHLFFGSNEEHLTNLLREDMEPVLNYLKLKGIPFQVQEARHRGPMS